MSATLETAPSRTCNVTGFEIDRQGQQLALYHAVGAVVLLAFGGTLAILIALQRQVIPISDDWW